MTAPPEPQSTAGRLVHVSTIRGDDQLGDGSRELPVRTKRRGKQIAGPHDLLCVDNLVQAEPRLSAGSKVLICGSLAALSWLIVAALIYNRDLAVLLVAAVAMYAVCFDQPKPTAERQAELDRPQVQS